MRKSGHFPHCVLTTFSLLPMNANAEPDSNYEYILPEFWQEQQLTGTKPAGISTKSLPTKENA